MGFRFRKSINLGGGFRINISKSGIGYSWGTKGYRITKTAKGTVRETASIPGTGISYVKEYKNHKKANPTTKNIPISDTNCYDTENIVNASAAKMVSDGLEDILSSARKTLLVNKLSTIGLVLFFILGCVYPILFVLFIACLIMKIYAKTAGRIALEYDIDEDQKDTIKKRMEPMILVTKSNKVWRIIQSSKVIDQKYSAGAGSTVKRVSCSAFTNIPYPFKSSITGACFKYGKETLIFLPDKLFILQGSKVGALSYSDLSTYAHTTRFVEHEQVPKDASIVGQAWQYVNKNGGPDKRFKNNRQMPICLYGEIELKSISGLNTVIMFSNADLK